MTYSEAKASKIEELIDTYTKDTLDSFVRLDIKQKAVSKMKESGVTEVDVADTVFDYIYKNYSSNETFASMCQQICPKSRLLVLRSDIIKELK
jgi:hypothetical protein